MIESEQVEDREWTGSSCVEIGVSALVRNRDRTHVKNKLRGLTAFSKRMLFRNFAGYGTTNNGNSEQLQQS
jgi:hypothetical protein